MKNAARYLTLFSYFALTIMLFVWNIWISPSKYFPISLVLLVLVVPLILLMRGLLHANIRTHILTSYISLFYLALGINDYVAVPSERLYASLEIIFGFLLYVGCSAFAFLAVRDRKAQQQSE